MSKLTTTRELIIPIPKGGAVEMVDGRKDASYYPLSTGLGVVATLIAARNGQFPRPSVMVDHLNDSLAIEIDRLVELHLEQFRAALFKAIKSETSECEFHVLRPTLELRFQLMGNFTTEDTEATEIKMTEEGTAPEPPCLRVIPEGASQEEVEALLAQLRPNLQGQQEALP